MLDNEVQAAEALEKFAFDMSSMYDSAVEGAKSVANTVGDAARSAGSYVGNHVADGWNGLPEGVRQSAVTATGGAALAALIEAMNNKKKKNYLSRATLGGGIGALLPHMGDNASTILKFAEGGAGVVDDSTNWMSGLMNHPAMPALAGAGVGALGGALVGRKGRRGSSALLGGLAGAGLGAATPKLMEAINAYRSHGDGQKAIQDALLGPKRGLPSGVGPNRDTMMNHAIDTAGRVGSTVSGVPEVQGAAAGAVLGAGGQYWADKARMNSPATAKDVLDMYRPQEGAPAVKDKATLSGDINTELNRYKPTTPELDDAYRRETIHDRDYWKDSPKDANPNPGPSHPVPTGTLDAHGRPIVMHPTPKTNSPREPDYGKAEDALNKKLAPEFDNISRRAADAVPTTSPQHSWRGWLESLIGRNTTRHGEIDNHIHNSVMNSAAADHTTSHPGGPQAVNAGTATAIDQIRARAANFRNEKLHMGTSPIKATAGRYIKGGVGKGAAIGAALPTIQALASKLWGNSQE